MSNLSSATIDLMLEDLCKAASDGDMGRVKGLCETLGHHSHGSIKGVLPLHCAAASGRTKICKYFIEQLNFDAKQQDFKGFTAFHHACHQGRRATVEYLANLGVDIGGKDNDGSTALCLATLQGHTEVMEMLLKAGANAKDSTPKGTLLQVSARRGDEDAVQLLLKFDADPNEYKTRTFSPLCSAILAKSSGSVELLLKAKADPNAVCFRSTPLHFAVSDGVVEMIYKLIEAKADPYALDANPYSPLELAAALSRPGHFSALLGFSDMLTYYSNLQYDTIKSELLSPHACQQRIMKSKQNVDPKVDAAMQFYNETGNISETISRLSLVIRECPWHSNALVRRALLFTTGEDANHAAAARDCEICFRVDPDNVTIDMCSIGALACYNTDNFKRAVNFCNVGLGIDIYHKKLQEIKAAAEAELEKTAAAAAEAK